MKKRKFYDGGMTEEEVYAKPLAKASFKEAFAEAREAGNKTFEYMGKKYTTDLASDKKKSDDTKYGEDKEMVRKAYQTAGEMRKPKVNEKERQRKLSDEKGLETVSVVDKLPLGRIAGAGIATAAALKGMSTLGKRAAAQEAAEKTAKKATVDKIKAGKEAAKKSRAESSGAMKGDVRGDELRYKKGGMVGSASKRADGCAVRGKTRA